MKIRKLEDIPAVQKDWQNKKVVLVGGCFDLLHYGHYTFLKNAKAAGDILVVALESDEFIIQRKKRASVHNQQQRAEILAALESVDYVILLPLFTENSQYADLVSAIKPTVIAVTEGDVNVEHKQNQAKAIGAEVKVVTPALEKFSTSSILEYASLFSD